MKWKFPSESKFSCMELQFLVSGPSDANKISAVVWSYLARWTDFRYLHRQELGPMVCSEASSVFAGNMDRLWPWEILGFYGWTALTDLFSSHTALVARHCSWTLFHDLDSQVHTDFDIYMIMYYIYICYFILFYWGMLLNSFWTFWTLKFSIANSDWPDWYKRR